MSSMHREIIHRLLQVKMFWRQNGNIDKEGEKNNNKKKEKRKKESSLAFVDFKG